MSLDDLDQALFEAKWGDTEEDVMEVIARILELPREAVERVLYAMEVVHGDVSKQVYNAGPTLDDELKRGLKSLVQEGVARVLVRNAINNDKPMLAPPQLLIKDPTEICSGCEWSIPCVSNNYSTPQECYVRGPPVGILQPSARRPVLELQRLRNGAALVTPIKIVKNTVTVTCTHPRGTFKIAAKELST